MGQQFNSKYNIGQSVSEGIYLELTKASSYLEQGLFDKAFQKYKSIKGKIPVSKIDKAYKKAFKELDKYYNIAKIKKNVNLRYNVIVKYNEYLILALDKNSMYLPSLRDTSQFV